jgi:hypothetical protein
MPYNLARSCTASAFLAGQQKRNEVGVPKRKKKKEGEMQL